MKKSNEQRKSDRRKKRDEENFWKIMYLTSDDTDDYVTTPPIPPIPPVSIKQRKLPILPFKRPILGFFSSTLNKIDPNRKVFNKRVGVGVGGLLVGGGLVVVAYQRGIIKFEMLSKILESSIVPSTADIQSFLTNIYKKLTYPFTDGGKEEEDSKKLFETHKDDSIIKEWNDLDLSLTIFEDKNYEQIINYFSAFKLVNATLNNFKISDEVMKILKPSITEQSDNTIDIFCDFLNQVRKEMKIKNDCFSDLKIKFTTVSATTIYIGYIDNKDKKDKKDDKKVIKYNNNNIDIELIYTESTCKNKSMVYLKNIFTNKSEDKEDKEDEHFDTAIEDEEYEIKKKTKKAKSKKSSS